MSIVLMYEVFKKNLTIKNEEKGQKFETAVENGEGSSTAATKTCTSIVDALTKMWGIDGFLPKRETE